MERAPGDNVIFVPFRNADDLYQFVSAGGDAGLGGRATGCETWVVETIVKFKRRQMLKRKYTHFGLKGPTPA